MTRADNKNRMTESDKFYECYFAYNKWIIFYSEYWLKYDNCHLIVLFISLEKDKLISLWKAGFNLTAAQFRLFSSVFLSNKICFILAMPTKYWVQATFLLITVHKNSNQALQDLIQYLGFLEYWHGSRCYALVVKSPVFLPRSMQTLKQLLLPLIVMKFRNEWPIIPNLREPCLCLSSKNRTSASLLNITHSRYMQIPFLGTPSFIFSPKYS